MVRSHLCLLATQCGWCGCEANSSSSNSMAIHLGSHTSKHHELSCELHFGLRIRTDFMDHWHEITVSFMRQNHNAIEHGTVIVSIVGPVIPDSASSLWHWDSLCSTRLPSMLHHNEKSWERTAPCWGFLVRIKFWDADSLFMYRFRSQLMLCCATCCHFHVCATFSPVSWGILQRLINTSQFTKLCRQGEPVSCLCHWPFDSASDNKDSNLEDWHHLQMVHYHSENLLVLLPRLSAVFNTFPCWYAKAEVKQILFYFYTNPKIQLNNTMIFMSPKFSYFISARL